MAINNSKIDNTVEFLLEKLPDLGNDASQYESIARDIANILNNCGIILSMKYLYH